MKSIKFLFLLSFVVLLLAACNEQTVSFNDVLEAVKDEGIPIKQRTYDGKPAKVNTNLGEEVDEYSLNGKSVLIYIFKSKKEKDKEIKKRRDMAEAGSPDSIRGHAHYEAKNAFIFYLYDDELNNDIDVKFKTAMRTLE